MSRGAQAESQLDTELAGQDYLLEQEGEPQLFPELMPFQISQELELQEVTNQTEYERPLVIVVPSYKNEAWCLKNLDSIFSQQYTNFRVILIIDDARQDATLSKVQEYLKERDLADKVTIIANQTRRGALANHIEAVSLCKDWEIVVQLDGDDWFAHDLVLARVNAAYADPNVWLTYGQHEVYPKGKKGQCRAVPKNVLKLAAYREYAWITSALRTFYAGLFKQIKLEDFIDEGAFFATSCDFAFMIPMLEMAQGKIKFIDEILYIYNCETPLNDYKKNLQQQLHNEYVIRARAKYTPLAELTFDAGHNQESRVAMVILSVQPMALKKLLNSVQTHLRNCSNILVMAQAGNDAVLRLYQTVEQELGSNSDFCITTAVGNSGKSAAGVPEPVSAQAVSLKTVPVKFVYTQPGTCKQLLLQELYNCPQDYILFTDDRQVLFDSVDGAQLTKWLARTHAHGFYLARGVDCTKHPLLERPIKKPKLVTLAPGICAWQFKHGEYEWAAAYAHDMVLYKKAFLIDTLTPIKAGSLELLLYGWRLQYHTPDAVGLCFDHAPAITSVLR